MTHLKRPWCWERLKAGGEGDDRGWDGWWHHQLNEHEFEQAPGVCDNREAWRTAVHEVSESDTTEQMNWRAVLSWAVNLTSIGLNFLHEWNKEKKIKPLPQCSHGDYVSFVSKALGNYIWPMVSISEFLQLVLLLWKWKWDSLSHVWLFATPWTIQSMEFSRPEYWRG